MGWPVGNMLYPLDVTSSYNEEGQANLRVRIVPHFIKARPKCKTPQCRNAHDILSNV